MDKTRIFVSSTCYDLSQVRRDLEAFIEGCGHQPVLSDSPGVTIPTGLDTIEACRWLVHSSDVFVLIIGGRYGSADETTGKSITNLEYETALAAGLPIYAFVDHEVWVKRDTYLRLREMVEDGTLPKDKLSDALGHKVEDPRVFEFLAQVTSAKRDSWVHEFTSAQDIVQRLKRSWSLLLKDLLDQRRQTTRSNALAQVQPVLEVTWQSISGDSLDVLEVSPPPDVDETAVRAQIASLRPSIEEVQLVRDNRIEIQRRLSIQRSTLSTQPGDTELSINSFEAFLANLDAVENALRDEPKKFRWRYNLISRLVVPSFVISNSGSCPAEELVIYIQSDNRAIFGDLASLNKVDLSLPAARPSHVEVVLQVAKKLSEPPPAQTPSALSNLFTSLEMPLSPLSPWTNARLPDVTSIGPRHEVQFSVEDGALRIDIGGRLKHGFVRRIAADTPMLYCFLAPGQQVGLHYQVYADNLAVPARGLLRIRATD